MDDKILQGITVGIVAGLFVYWLTNKRQYACKDTRPGAYAPLYGDVRTVQGGTPSDVACNPVGGLTAHDDTYAPLASDYLSCAPDYAPPVSSWNVGVSLQLSCEDLSATVFRNETATAFPHGLAGPNTTPQPIKVIQKVSCAPNVPLPVDCTEVV